MSKSVSTKYLTRGGQITLHNFRMLFQINKAIGTTFFLLLLLLTAMIAFIKIDYETAVNTYYHYLAGMLNAIGDSKTLYETPIHGHVYKNTVATIATHRFFIDTADLFVHQVYISVLIAFVISIGSVIAISMLLKRRGKAHGQSKVLRGATLVTPKELTKEIKKRFEISPYTFASIPLPYGAETQHIQIVGTTGSGKTNCIRELISQIQARGDRAVIYDKGGTYISHFYRENKDIILNPLDERGMSWDIWQECDDKADFEAIAEALMPTPANSNIDPFWINAARMIFVSAAYRLRNDPSRSNLLLLQYLLTKDIGSIYKLIKNTESESLVSEKVEKTALNVKSVMATYLKSLMYVRSDGDMFSIREWVKNESQGQCLFISSNGSKHKTLKPLISSWISTATKEVLSLSENSDRRIWFILDELATLHLLPFLEMAKSETRKFGGCFVLGFHGNSQLRSIYGSDGASNLSNFCSTQLFMRLNEDTNQKWASDNLGTYEVEEVNEGISYGANTMRDGVNISRQIKEKKVVLPTEIKMLDDLEGYLKSKGSLPPCKVKFKYTQYPKFNPEYIQRDIETTDLSERVAKLVDQYDRPIIDKQEKPEKSNTDLAISQPPKQLETEIEEFSHLD